MDIKNIILVMRSEAECEGQLRFAAGLAEAFDGAVEGVCVFSETELARAPAMAGPEAAQAVGRDQARQVTAAYSRTFGAGGRSIGWSVVEGEQSGWKIIRRARVADLIIVGAPGGDLTARRLVESLALQSGAPCLLIPCAATWRGGFDRVVLAWDGSREAKQAMDRGMPFLKRAQSVTAVMVRQEGAVAKYEAHSAALLAHLARHGVMAELQLIARPGKNIGDTLIDQCASYAADLLLMGAYGHHHATGMVLGSATRTLLTRTPLPILMAH
jgi:nucleotide-binding universal stress UspA family protein